MNHAYVLIRAEPHYRCEAFCSGLKAIGYQVHKGTVPATVNKGDLIVCWNRYSHFHDLCTRVESQGGIAIICENGYVGVDRSNRQIYAMAIGGHNGRGRWPTGSPERWQALGIQLQPWKAGRHVLVSANRSFGTPGGIMPDDWMVQVRDRLKKLTQRPVVFRAHPGNDKPKRPFSADLEGAHCVIIWSSSTGCEALIAGVPVICLAPWWICKDAAESDLAKVESVIYDDAKRLAAFERLAHAQYSVEEISSGLAFKALLQC